MFDRVVLLAVSCAIACFLFVVIWPLFDDDRPSAIQAGYFAGGLVVVVATAYVYWRSPRR
jgi:hypothetical protein